MPVENKDAQSSQPTREELRAKLRAKIRGAREQPAVRSTLPIDATGTLMRMGIDDVDILRQVKDTKDPRQLLQMANLMEISADVDSDDEEAPPPYTASKSNESK